MNFTNYNNNKRLSFIAALLLGAMALLGLQACGGSGGGSDPDPVPDANPAGYYKGLASVKQADNSTAFEIDDLQVFVNGTRIMAMSVSNVLLYDITITDITVNNFTGTVTVYENGALLDTTTMEGTISEGVTLAGTFAGAGVVNGSFAVNFDTVINSKTSGLDVSYSGNLNKGTSTISFDIDVAGNVISSRSSINAPKFAYCEIVAGSTFTAVANQNLYLVKFVMNSCDDNTVNGTYTGLAITSDDPSLVDAFMPITFSNGSFAGTADLTI